MKLRNRTEYGFTATTFPLIFGTLLAVPALALSIYTGLDPTIEPLESYSSSDFCVTAFYKDNPSIVSKIGDCSSEENTPPVDENEEVTPPIETTPPVEETEEDIPPIIEEGKVSEAFCNEIKFTSVPNVDIACAYADVNGSQDTIDVTVSTKSTTPIKWEVGVDAANTVKGFQSAALWSPALNGYTVNTPTFKVVGVDRSGNHLPETSVNYAYVSDIKTITFTVQVAWR